MIRRVTRGDVFSFSQDILAHVVDCSGEGFTKQVHDRYPEVFQKYQETCRTSKKSLSGAMQVLYLTTDNIVVNLFGKDSFKNSVDYNALFESLIQLLVYAEDNEMSIALSPKLIPFTLQGEEWRKINAIVEVIFEDSPIDVVIYEDEEDYQ